MARQIGILKVSGRIGDLVFYESRDGYIVRANAHGRSELMKTDPRFERTRESSKEFGAAIRAASLMRRALRQVDQDLCTVDFHRQINQLFLRIKNEDGISKRGARCVQEGLKTKQGQFQLKSFLVRLKSKDSDFERVQVNFIEEKLLLQVPQFCSQYGMKGICLCLDFDLNEMRIEWKKEIGNGSLNGSNSPLHKKTEHLETEQNMQKPLSVWMASDDHFIAISDEAEPPGDDHHELQPCVLWTKRQRGKLQCVRIFLSLEKHQPVEIAGF